MLILGRNLTVSAWSHRNNHERLFYQIGIKGKLDHDPLPKITALRTCRHIRSETLGVLIALISPSVISLRCELSFWLWSLRLLMDAISYT